MIALWLVISLCFAGEFSPTCPSNVDDFFVDHVSADAEDNWQTPLTEETLDEIRDVISERGPLTNHRRTLTSRGVQCWYKMPTTSKKKIEFIIQNYEAPSS
jgi:hypothetical protein